MTEAVKSMYLMFADVSSVCVQVGWQKASRVPGECLERITGVVAGVDGEPARR